MTCMLALHIATKLRPPRLRTSLISRPRLTGKVGWEAGRRLTLVSAPAGFGKTTLLSEWARSSKGQRSVAWLSLDEGDNDPARFVSYMVAAFRTFREGIGEGVLSSLASPRPAPFEALTGALINELAGIPGEKVLILDDYHRIYAEPVHGIVSFLLEHLPEDMHLILAGRVDPPLPLSRLRSRNQMAELRAADVAFTLEEAAAFLSEVMELELPAGEVTALEERTEGWIAGLQLAALSMRNREDVSGFVRTFSGSHRDILDYLSEEVLSGQPASARTFLLQTSILNTLTAPLCDALTGSSGSQAMLERLERDNLFVVPLDDERRWYRHHHLFADFLRGRLERESPERVAELHLRAAAWHERNGWTSAAVGHALSAEDHYRAASLIERTVGEMWFRGEVLTLLGWLHALPEEERRRRPQLLLEHATALMIVGRLEDVEPILQRVGAVAGAVEKKSADEPPSDTAEARRRYLLGYVAAIRAWRVVRLGEPRNAIDYAREALALLPEHEPRPRIIASFSLAGAYQATGDLKAASVAFSETSQLAWTAGSYYAALGAMARQAELQTARGRLHEAEVTLREALRLAAARGDAALLATGELRVAMGNLLYERNDLEAASDQIAQGLTLAERIGRLDTMVEGQLALSRIAHARGNPSGALERALVAEHLAQNSGASEVAAEATVWKMRLHLASGDAEATAYEQAQAAGPNKVPPSMREKERVSHARLLIARGEHDDALRLLRGLRAAAETAGKTGDEIRLLVLEALTLWAKGEKERAVRNLARSLALAEPDSYVRTFVDEGSAMVELLSEVLELQQRRRLVPPAPTHYLRKLLAALEQDATDSARMSAKLPEPLSERELEVLVLMAAGKTNRQIAEEMYVAPSTVKTHTKNIYRKLDVRNRTQALACAREVELI